MRAYARRERAHAAGARFKPFLVLHRGDRVKQLSYGDTLDEARSNLREAVLLVLEANRELSRESLEGHEVLREPIDFPSAA